MDRQYTSREKWSSIWTASTPVESSGVQYGLPAHQQRAVEFYTDWQYTSREYWYTSTGVLYGLPVHQQRVVEFYTDCKYTSREQWSSIWTASTPVESSRVLYGQPVERSGVLYGLPVHQQRVVEFYMDCQYTSREQWSSIWTACTPVESSGVLYGLPVNQ